MNLTNNPMISFIIVNFHTSSYVINLVQSIEKFICAEKFEILILDNSEDENEFDTLSSIRNACIKLFKSASNIGFVAGNNFLYQKASGGVIVLINPDTRLIDTSLIDLIKYLLSDYTIAVAGPQLLNEDFSYQVSFFKFPHIFTLLKEYILLFTHHAYEYHSNHLESRICDVVKGACLVINRKIWRDEKIFDEKFIMYSEEVDLCKRVHLSGLKIYYFADAKVIHFGEKSSTLSFAGEYSLFNYYWSRLIYFHKFNGRFYYLLIKIILIISLIEKSILLFTFRHTRNARLHFKVLKRIIYESKNIDSL